MFKYEHAISEPALAEIIDDPIIRALMRYDAVEEDEIVRLAQRLEDIKNA